MTGVTSAEISSPPLLHLVTEPSTHGEHRRWRWSALFLALIGLGLGASSAWSGLYDVSVWGPAAIVLLVVVVAVLASEKVSFPIGSMVVMGGTIGLAVWSLISTSWAESVPNAESQANLWVGYAALMLVMLTLVRDDSDRRLLLVATGVAGALVEIVLGIHLATGHAMPDFVGGRLVNPAGYANGEASALLLVFWPAVAVAERHRNTFVRGLAAAVAMFGLALMMLTESRGAVLALVVSVLLVMAVAPGRVTRGWLLVVIFAGLATVTPVMTGVLRHAPLVNGVGVVTDPAVHHAVRLALLASVITGVVWGLIAWAPGHVLGRASATNGRLAGWGLVAILVLAAAGGIAVGGNPVTKAKRGIQAFTHLRPIQGNSDRLLNGGSNRWDYWRVAMLEFDSHPIVGVGAGNYTTYYFELRHTSEDIEQPHSLELQTLSELGLVGAALLAVALLPIFVLGIGRVRRASSPAARATAVAALGTFTVWFAQTSIDWMHLIPGLTGIALCAAVVLLPPARPLTTTGLRRLVPVGTLIAVAVVGAAGIGRLTLADHYLTAGQHQVAQHPVAAFHDAQRALELQPGLLPALYVEASAYARRDDYPDARATLLAAARLAPHNFIPYALLGDLAERRGLTAVARHDYERALVLNPRDPNLRALLASPLTRG